MSDNKKMAELFTTVGVCQGFFEEALNQHSEGCRNLSDKINSQNIHSDVGFICLHVHMLPPACTKSATLTDLYIRARQAKEVYSCFCVAAKVGGRKFVF